MSARETDDLFMDFAQQQHAAKHSQPHTYIGYVCEKE